MSEYWEISRDLGELPTWRPQADPTWIDTDHQAVAACAEALELAEKGDMPGLEARLERLYAGLYRAYQQNWLVKPDARISMRAALDRVHMEAIKNWCKGDDRAAARWGVLLSSACWAVLQRMGGRRIGSHRSARDMLNARPSPPETLRRDYRGCPGIPGGKKSEKEIRLDWRDHQLSWQDLLQKEANLRALGIDDEEQEPDILSNSGSKVVKSFIREAYFLPC